MGTSWHGIQSEPTTSDKQKVIYIIGTEVAPPRKFRMDNHNKKCLKLTLSSLAKGET